MKIAKTPQNLFQLISLRILTHVLVNSQLWITHPLPLSGFTCLQSAIATSLAVPWDYSSFFLRTVPIEFPNVRETEKGLKPPFVLFSYDSFFSLHKHYLVNPNGASVRNWISNNISKFHYNPTVNETRIVVFIKIALGFCGKEKGYNAKGISLSSNMISKIPNGENARNWVANMVLKCHDDPTVNESEIFIFLRQVWWTAEKRKGFGKRIEKKRNWEAEDAEESVWKLT